MVDGGKVPYQAGANQKDFLSNENGQEVANTAAVWF